jgi:D-glycero-D-manno-heptose 1,7-bisphosphate phosphatase
MGIALAMSNQSMRRAVFLDRDGVINRVTLRNGKPYPPNSVAALDILPGVHEALLRLKNAGFMLIVVSNQPDVARGTTTREAVETIHERLADSLPIDRFMVCYHDTSDNCDCRKPRPGMLLASAKELLIDLTKSYMVGDRWRDIEAGNRAGCKTLFIDSGYLEESPHGYDFRVASLLEAASIILDT